MEKVDSEGIGKWVDTLGLGCKNALTRDYAYFESSVEKFGQMKDMFAQVHHKPTQHPDHHARPTTRCPTFLALSATHTSAATHSYHSYSRP